MFLGGGLGVYMCADSVGCGGVMCWVVSWEEWRARLGVILRQLVGIARISHKMIT